MRSGYNLPLAILEDFDRVLGVCAALRFAMFMHLNQDLRLGAHLRLGGTCPANLICICSERRRECSKLI